MAWYGPQSTNKGEGGAVDAQNAVFVWASVHVRTQVSPGAAHAASIV
jgi:hypothetical protein